MSVILPTAPSHLPRSPFSHSQLHPSTAAVPGQAAPSLCHIAGASFAYTDLPPLHVESGHGSGRGGRRARHARASSGHCRRRTRRHGTRRPLLCPAPSPNSAAEVLEVALEPGMLAGDAGPLSSPDALTGVAMSLSTLSDLPNAPPGKFGSSPGSGKQRELTLEGGTTNLQHAREATSRRRSRQQQLGPMHDDEKSRGLQEAKCSSQRAATRRLGEVYDGFFSKQGEGRGGVDLQLQEHHQQVRGEAHARTGRHVKEFL